MHAAPQAVPEQQQEEVKEVERPKKSLPISEELKECQKEIQGIDKSVKEKLGVLEMAELEYMKENEDYMQDFCLSLPQVIKIEKLYEKGMGLSKTLAEGNQEKEK